jgi:hypothetical protein
MYACVQLRREGRIGCPHPRARPWALALGVAHPRSAPGRVAQLARAPRLHRGGRPFESGRAHQEVPAKSQVSAPSFFLGGVEERPRIGICAHLCPLTMGWSRHVVTGLWRRHQPGAADAALAGNEGSPPPRSRYNVGPDSLEDLWARDARQQCRHQRGTRSTSCSATDSLVPAQLVVLVMRVCRACRSELPSPRSPLAARSRWSASSLPTGRRRNASAVTAQLLRISTARTAKQPSRYTEKNREADL